MSINVFVTFTVKEQKTTLEVGYIHTTIKEESEKETNSTI
jgi:hypothetical protein